MVDIAYRPERYFFKDNEPLGWSVRYNSNDAPETAAGPCPVCGHHTEKKIELELTTAGTVGADVAPVDPREWITRVVECACGEPHQDLSKPPKQFSSCGGWWLVSVRLTKSDTEPNIRAAYDESLLKAAQAVEGAVANEETKLRSSAEKWTGALTALFGLFGLASLVFGKDAFAGLSGAGRLAAVIAVLLALIAAVAGTYFVYRAAYGWPVITDVGNDEKMRSWYDNRRYRLKDAAQHLQRGVPLAIGSVALLAVAAAVIWLSPGETPKPLVTLTRVDQSEVCGTLLNTEANATAQLRIRKPSGDIVPVPVAQVSTVTAVTSCP